MKLHDKIRQIRKDKGLSLQDLENILKGIFGQNALRYNTLYRIEKGLRDARVASLSQICIGLGVSLKELKEGTEQEAHPSLVDAVKKRDKIASYVYSEKAVAQILSKDKLSFLALRLILEPGGKTKLEQDPVELGNFQKWIYVLKGNVTCVIGQERHILGKDESLSFESTIPHYFENNTGQKSACLVIQNPRHI